MAYLSEETIAANGSQSLTVPTGAKRAKITARGGNFSYRFGAQTPTAVAYHALFNSGDVEIEDKDMAGLRIIRDVADTGSLYVTYFDAYAKLPTTRL